MDAEEFRVAGLYDPDAPEAEDRLALLRLLEAEGATVVEMQAALADERLIGLAVDAVVRPPGDRMTFAEMCTRAGFDADYGSTVLEVAGFPMPDPSDRVYTDADVRCFHFVAAMAVISDGRAGLQIIRVASAAMSSLAEAELAAVRSSIEGPMRAAGTSDYEQAQSFRGLAAVLPELANLLDVFHRRHLLAGMRSRILWDAGRPSVEAAIGFADLVGYTTRAHALDTTDLALMVDRFETTAREVIGRNGGRLVKLIGDEVMYQAATARVGCNISLDLLKAFAADPDLPSVRIGLGFGQVLAFEGDYYGGPVNQAARLVKMAEPATALVDGHIKEHAGNVFAFRDVGRRDLKGIGAVDTFELVAPQRS